MVKRCMEGPFLFLCNLCTVSMFHYVPVLLLFSFLNKEKKEEEQRGNKQLANQKDKYLSRHNTSELVEWSYLQGLLPGHFHFFTGRCSFSTIKPQIHFLWFSLYKSSKFYRLMQIEKLALRKPSHILSSNLSSVLQLAYNVKNFV